MALPLAVDAQSTTSLRGTVTDPSGSAIPDAVFTFSEKQVSQLPLETRNVVELLSLQAGAAVVLITKSASSCYVMNSRG